MKANEFKFLEEAEKFIEIARNTFEPEDRTEEEKK